MTREQRYVAVILLAWLLVIWGWLVAAKATEAERQATQVELDLRQGDHPCTLVEAVELEHRQVRVMVVVTQWYPGGWHWLADCEGRQHHLRIPRPW